MKILERQPPNIDAIREVFDVPEGVIFCYGDAIYNPGRGDISPELHAHEQIHSDRQGDDPDGWWEKYMADAAFRLEEEMLAHRAEYQKFLENGPSRNQRRRRLQILAKRMSSAMYGRMISFEDAKRGIKFGELE